VTVVEEAPPAPPAQRTWRRPELGVLLLFVPLVASLVVLGRHHWYPAGDMAQAELHLRGFLRHPPLVGAAGRIGTLEDQGSHPGPSMWFALYPVYRLFGASSFGLMASVTALNVASLVGIVLVARRRGGGGLVLALLPVLAVLVRASGPAFFVEPWNPWVAVLPFLLFLLLVWGAADDDVVLVPWAVAVGVHCVQSHVGYLLLVAGLLGLLVVWLGLRSWRTGTPHPRALGKWLAVGAGIGVLMWVPPIVDQLVRDPGNLGILWRHFSNPTEPYVGLGGALKAFAGEVNLFGPWVVGRGHLPSSSPNLVGFLGIVAVWLAGIAVAWRRRDRTVLLLEAVLVATAAIGIVAMSRVFGPFFDYVVRWLWPLAALVVATSVWSVARAVAAHRPDPVGARRRTVAAVSLGFTAVVVAVATAQFASRAVLPGEPDSRVIGGLVPQMALRLDPRAHYLVRWVDPVALGAVGFGSVLELEREGFHPGVDRWARAGSLPHRVLPEDRADGVVYIVLGPQIQAWRARPDAVELGSFDPRTPAEVARSAELRTSVERQLRDLGRDDLADRLDDQYGLGAALFAPGLTHQLAADLSELVGLRLEAAAFLVPPGRPDTP
jgi:hypothetical protein